MEIEKFKDDLIDLRIVLGEVEKSKIIDRLEI